MEHYTGEIRMLTVPIPPEGWLACNGQSLLIRNYQALYVVIGTLYGGDGITNFNLPDMRGRVPLHFGQGQGLSKYTIGQKTGTENLPTTVLSSPQQGTVPVLPISSDEYRPWPLTITGQHSIIQPVLTFNFIISTEGKHPRQNFDYNG
jgi:microcystin-dependent protein